MRHRFATTTENKIYQHPMIWCNGTFYNIDSFGLPVACHGLHYATTMFGGTGVRFCIDGQWRIFRAEDHVQRILDHNQGFGLKVPFSKEQILEALVRLCQYNLPHLNENQPPEKKTDDLYIRMVSFPADLGLGVGSSDKADFLAFSQDLTQYLHIPEGKTGASLLYPGAQLFCRGDERTSLSFFKSASNYGIGNLWKRIAKHFGAVETLAASQDEFNTHCLSETTGACIFLIMPDNTIITPSLENMCLDSITRRTIIDIFKTLDCNIIDHESVTEKMLWQAHCVFLAGTWAGPVFIEEIIHNPKRPSIPNDTLITNNGKEFFDWIIGNLNPEPHRYSTDNEAYQLFRKIEKIYWGIVRRDLSLVPAGMEIPASWHTLIPDITKEKVPLLPAL